MRLLPASKLSKPGQLPAELAGADRGAARSTSQTCARPGLETGSSSLTKNLHSVCNDNLNCHWPFKTGKSFAPSYQMLVTVLVGLWRRYQGGRARRDLESVERKAATEGS